MIVEFVVCRSVLLSLLVITSNHLSRRLVRWVCRFFSLLLVVLVVVGVLLVLVLLLMVILLS